MVKVYTIASGKGGTGKTTVSVNLGTMLAQLGKETFLMDADIGMANVGLLLGLGDGLPPAVDHLVRIGEHGQVTVHQEIHPDRGQEGDLGHHPGGRRGRQEAGRRPDHFRSQAAVAAHRLRLHPCGRSAARPGYGRSR